MRVLCLVPYPTLGASNRLRVAQYAATLRGEGIEIVVSPYLDDAGYAVLYQQGHTVAKAAGVARGLGRRLRDLLRARRYDLVLVHRESAPLGPPLVERLLHSWGVPYVYDFDDAIFLGSVHPVNRRWSWLRRPARLARAVSGAKAVIAGNDYLAQWARQHNDNVTVLATPVDTDRHRPRAGARPPGPFVVGWVGSSTTAPYLHLVDEPLARLAGRRPMVVRVVGGIYAHEGVPVELRPYRLEREPDDVASFDVGILPEPDDPWTRGKGAFKALLYMSAALPVVASRVGVNAQVVRDGESGYCVDDADGWVEALGRLADDPVLRERLGRSGRERVEREFSVRSLTPRLASVLRQAAASA